MAFLIFEQLTLFVMDLILASALSCFLYAWACLGLASLIVSTIFLSFTVVKRHIPSKGSAVMILSSNSSSSVGQMVGTMGFSVLVASQYPDRVRASFLKKEGSSTIKLTQLPVTEEKYQKAVKTLAESQLSLKGISKGESVI